MELKIHMGTPKGRDSLCRYCSRSQMVRGVDLQEVAFCNFGASRRIEFPVERCSAFEDARMPSLDDMKRIAWRVETRNRGRWGFSSDDGREVTVEPPYQKPDGLESPTVQRGVE